MPLPICTTMLMHDDRLCCGPFGLAITRPESWNGLELICPDFILYRCQAPAFNQKQPATATPPEP